MRRVVIDTFGPIEHVDMELDGSLDVIIGPQASGKSTLAKVIFFCRKVRDYLLEYSEKVMISNEGRPGIKGFCKLLNRYFMGYFGTTKHMNGFEITYYYDEDRYITIRLGKDGFTRFSFSNALVTDINGILKEVDVMHYDESNFSDDSYFERQKYVNNILKGRICRIFSDYYILKYIPAGRNIFAVIPNLVPSFASGSGYVDIHQVDLLTQEFIQEINSMRFRFGSRLEDIMQVYLKTENTKARKEVLDKACSLIRSILKADYVSDSEGEKLYYDSDRWVKLMFASSGQQEILWALNMVFLLLLKHEKVFLVFEEPESHLFPMAQKTVLELLALLINANDSEVFVTTHSPYIMTSANLLIYSSEVEGNDDGNSIVDRYFRLPAASVKSFYIDGTLENLTSEENSLLETSFIDGVSEEINEGIERLVELKIAREVNV